MWWKSLPRDKRKTALILKYSLLESDILPDNYAMSCKFLWLNVCYFSCACREGFFHLQLHADEALGQYNVKWPISLTYASKLRIAAKTATDKENSDLVPLFNMSQRVICSLVCTTWLLSCKMPIRHWEMVLTPWLATFGTTKNHLRTSWGWRTVSQNLSQNVQYVWLVDACQTNSKLLKKLQRKAHWAATLEIPPRCLGTHAHKADVRWWLYEVTMLWQHLDLSYFSDVNIPEETLLQ